MLELNLESCLDAAGRDHNRADVMRADLIQGSGARSFAELAALSLAKRFHKLGRAKDARRVLTTFLRQDPQSQAAKTALQSLLPY